MTLSSRKRWGFIGVTATASAINRVFPRWVDTLGLGDVELVPLDLPLDTPPAAYRSVVDDIAKDPLHWGAVVTSHKVRLLAATTDQFDELDRYAKLCREVSCISKSHGRLIGHAKDPITAGRAIEEFLAATHFRATGGQVLCFGAGGSGLAIAVHLLERRGSDGNPFRIALVSRSSERLETCREVLAELPRGGSEIDYIQNADPHMNDALMAGLPPGSLVVNATGMGKDQPGSPITEAGRFPKHGIAWELNYRGALDFLHQARAQQSQRALHVEDGWAYFVHGWSEAMAEAFHLRLTPELVLRLSDVASGGDSEGGNRKNHRGGHLA
jgi:shikimate dehydrogenase